MKKSLMMDRLLLVDADVVIEFKKQGYWKAVINRYKIHIAATVLREASYYEDDSGNKVPIDLSDDIRNGKVVEDGASLEQIQALLQKIPRDKIDLDPGELESVAIISNWPDEELKICVIDHAAVVALSFLKLRDRAISFEEIVVSCGIWRRGDKVPDHRLSKKRFEEWATEGNFIQLSEDG